MILPPFLPLLWVQLPLLQLNSPQPRNSQMDCQFATCSPCLSNASRVQTYTLTHNSRVCRGMLAYDVSLRPRTKNETKLVQAPQAEVRQAKPLRLLREAGYRSALSVHRCRCGEDVCASFSALFSLRLTTYPQRRAVATQPASNR